MLAVGAGWGCLDTFLSSTTSLFFLPLSGSRPDIDEILACDFLSMSQNQSLNTKKNFFQPSQKMFLSSLPLASDN